LFLLPQRSCAIILFGFIAQVERGAGSACEFSAADIAQNRKQPWLHRGPAVRIEMAQRAQIAFLRGILSIGRIAHQVPRQRIDVIEIRQSGFTKAAGFIMIVTAAVQFHLRRAGRFRNHHGLRRARVIQHHCAALFPETVSTTIIPVM
jgi:hypothetical protein